MKLTILFCLTLISLILITYFTPTPPCYTVNGPDLNRTSVSRNQYVDISANITNCISFNKRMYHRIIFYSSCGQSIIVATSSASNYKENESKYTYTKWRVPVVVGAGLFEEYLCKGTGTLSIVVYEKNFWGTSKYISQSNRYLTIK